MKKTDKHDTLISAVINNMSLQDKVNIANLSEDNIFHWGSIIGLCLAGSTEVAAEIWLAKI